MSEFNVSREKNAQKSSFTDFTGSIAYEADGFTEGLKFSFKTNKMRNGAIVKVAHVEGLCPETGEWLNEDLWPCRCQTMDDLKTMEAEPKDIRVRVGRYETTDPVTGDTIIIAGRLKLSGWHDGKQWHYFNGARPTWNDVENCTEYTNEVPKTEEEAEEAETAA